MFILHFSSIINKGQPGYEGRQGFDGNCGLPGRPVCKLIKFI